MANIILGATGSVASLRIPALVSGLRAQGHVVKVVATTAALYFFDPHDLDPSHPGRNPQVVIVDEDEWPGANAGQRYERNDPVLHIELRRWADLLLIAPLDANTLAKLAHGLADNCLTCVWRAWNPSAPILLAPAMNSVMWEHPQTLRHFRLLAADYCPAPHPEGLSLTGILDWINQHSPTLRVLGPITKRLACGDEGVGAMAEVADITTSVAKWLS